MLMEKIMNWKKNRQARRKGFSLPEILVACAIIIALSSAAFFGFNQAQQTRKMAQMQSELEAIATACLTYEALASDSMPPASLTELISGLSATDSIDGTAHTNLLTWTKSNASTAGEDGKITSELNNPWGNAYTYSQTDRTITTIPKDTSGTALTSVTRRF